ncbi:energy-coupling factor transporter transmembrane protein EcfT [Rhizobium sp. NTR19]|uniref:Energy-coupling factor transporter transmembrane protein EcfT n=1 Tax=Neorhizobium turbinariae TaxID=2937795 RepID=A0ABT0IRZ7_9HYPH|nr:energy-coupling factor transporter transmembrane protein EcfT [Neorhizobium turbinariae]MCK8780657.1 energy-coupling factor transporter transmembrane protein EcfT [Neorhizobium turbinariae]
MKTLYVQGDTWLHRLSPGLKLGGLAVFSLLLFVTASPVVLAAAVFLAGAIHASMCFGVARTWQQLRVILLSISILTVFTLLLNGPADALAVFLRLVALAVLAATITATTSTAEFIDTITAGARPLERIGLVKAADLGLAIGLVVRFVPEVLARYEAIRDAHHARGLKQRPLTLAVPLIIQTLRHADEIAAAIDARGIRGQNNRKLGEGS